MRFPQIERGFFHLTPQGWVRRDAVPFPDDRLETWRYEMEWPAEDAKEQVTLTKVWISPVSAEAANDQLRTRFGEPVKASSARNVKLECQI